MNFGLNFSARRSFSLNHILIVFLVLSHFSINSAEYVSQDEPNCRDDCLLANTTDKTKCYQEMIEFYTNKLVRSVFNYGKSSIYAGLWLKRNEKADDQLFGNVLNSTLAKYNNKKVLGSVNFDELQRMVRSIHESLSNYHTKKILVPYPYPSLKCPTMCTYELLTWQTLFYVSIAIFVLALITVMLYAVFLRKQYSSLKDRLKNVRYSKTAENSNN